MSFTVDAKITFASHVRDIDVRVKMRLSLMRQVSTFLPDKGCCTLYNNAKEDNPSLMFRWSP